MIFSLVLESGLCLREGRFLQQHRGGSARPGGGLRLLQRHARRGRGRVLARRGGSLRGMALEQQRHARRGALRKVPPT